MQTNDTSQDTPVLISLPDHESTAAVREDLLAAGVGRDAIELRVLQDEAGPVEGNFLIGNGVALGGRRPQGVLSGAEVPYRANFATTVARGSHLLIVRVESEEQRRDVLDIASRRGGIDVEAARAR